MARVRRAISFFKHRLQALLGGVQTGVRCWQHRGNRFHCPLCDRHFDHLLPSRGVYFVRGDLVDHFTDNSLCPGCGSGIRHRFVFSFLKQAISSWPAGMKLLHFAPEPALYRFFQRQRGLDYVPADLLPIPKLSIRKIDITEIGFPEGHFDLAVCIHVLEHIADDRRAIAEIFRVLRPGGQAVLAVPIYGTTTFEDPDLDHDGRVKMYGIGDHMRLNGLDLQAKLAEAGFQVQPYTTDMVPGNYMDHQATSPHVETDKHLFWCHKPLAQSTAHAA